MSRLIAIALLANSSAALATGERIVVLSPAGASAVRPQLVETLCLSEDCIAPEKVLSGGRLDWAKVGRERVGAVVVGRVATAKKGPAQVELSVMANNQARVTRRVALNDANKLTVKDLVSFSADALSAVDSPRAKAEDASQGIVRHEKQHAKAVAHRPGAKAKATKRVAARPHWGRARG